MATEKMNKTILKSEAPSMNLDESALLAKITNSIKSFVKIFLATSGRLEQIESASSKIIQNSFTNFIYLNFQKVNIFLCINNNLLIFFLYFFTYLKLLLSMIFFFF